jgi:hypothetical protein
MISPNLVITSPPPTTFPLSATHILMLLLPPTLLLPILPSSAIPFLLLPLGILPPIIFHPAFIYAALWSQGFLRPSRLKQWRAKAERWVLTDRLDDSIARSEIREVRVWENERLDPAWKPEPFKQASVDPDLTGQSQGAIIPPESAWSSRFLKSSERRPWVRVLPRNPTLSLWSEALPAINNSPPVTSDGRVALSLVPGWSFVPGEEWRVDLAADWSTSECDEAGWVYCDDAWENARSGPVVVRIPDGAVPIHVTRRRQWWRRVYSTSL